MKRKYWWLIGVGGVGAALVVMGVLRTPDELPPPDAPPVTVRISAGLPAAPGFMQLGEALVAEYAKQMPDVTFVTVESPGSMRNLQNVQRGEADLGFTQADMAYMGYNGQLRDSSERFTNIRGIAVMHSALMHLLARGGVPIRSISDLEGQRVGVGRSDSGTALTSELLLNAFHLKQGKVAGYPFAPSQAVDELTRGELDATFVVAADPSEEVRRATEAGARLIDIQGPEVDRVRSEHPFLRVGVIPGGMYPGHLQPVRTLAIDVLLVARTGLDEELVHRLTRAFFHVLPRVVAQLEFVRTMDPTRASASPVPLHPGAALYYREQELSR